MIVESEIAVVFYVLIDMAKSLFLLKLFHRTIGVDQSKYRRDRYTVMDRLILLVHVSYHDLGFSNRSFWTNCVQVKEIQSYPVNCTLSHFSFEHGIAVD